MGVSRMTVRSWMLAVAIVAIGLAAIPVALHAIASLLDDVYQSARTKVERTWPVRAAPKIIVDVFDGGIWVHPGEPGAVRRPSSLTALARTVRSKRQKASKVVDVA